MELNKKDRLILFNQYEILKILNPENKKDYEVDQEILLNGFKYNYSDLASGLLDETEEEISRFVFDVFEMYRSLNNSYGELSLKEKEEIKIYDLSFKGYDGNEEIEYYMYAGFLLNKFNRYGELKESEHFALNSHSRKVETYKVMLSKWEEVRNERYGILSLDAMRQIINRY